MNKNRKVNALKDIMPQDLKGTNFKSKKIKKKRNWLAIFSIMIPIALSLVIVLVDLTAERVSIALYPTIEVAEAQILAPELSIEEHICAATGGENCDVLINLARCESALNKDAYHVNTNNTVDLGLFQINSVHKDISSSEKLDVYASARWSNDKIKSGQGSIWVCWDRI